MPAVQVKDTRITSLMKFEVIVEVTCDKMHDDIVAKYVAEDLARSINCSGCCLHAGSYHYESKSAKELEEKA